MAKGKPNLPGPITGALCALVEPMRVLVVPHFRPAIAPHCGVEGQQRIPMSCLPMHACPFESGLHQQCVGTFHHARANRPPLLLRRRSVHTCFSRAQILQWLFESLNSQRRSVHAGECLEQQAWPPMFEDMQTLFHDLMRQGEASLCESAHTIAHALGGMGEISDPSRIRSMQIHQILEPERAVGDRTDLGGLTSLPPLRFHVCSRDEGCRIHHAGEGGAMIGPHLRARVLHCSHGHRPHVRPWLLHQRHRGPITPQDQLRLGLFARLTEVS